MFVDPKITLSGDSKSASTLIRLARVYLDTQLRQDAAYNRQVSKTKKLLPGGAYIEATHEFGRTYLHIHVPESVNAKSASHKKSDTSAEVYGSSGLYLWGAAVVDGNPVFREYLISHVAPYVFLLGEITETGVSAFKQRQDYTYPDGSGTNLAPFTQTVVEQGYAFNYPRLCAGGWKSVVYLPTAYQEAQRNGVTYRLPGYVPFAYALACGKGFDPTILNTIVPGQNSLAGEYIDQWALCFNPPAYLQRSLTDPYLLTFPEIIPNTPESMSTWPPDFSKVTNIGPTVVLWPDEMVGNSTAGSVPSANLPPESTVIPPDLPAYPSIGNIRTAAQTPTIDGKGNLHGFLNPWTPTITSYAGYPDGNHKSMSVMASAPVWGGSPSAPITEDTLQFNSTFTWVDQDLANATTAAWWGDLFQTNWQYGQWDAANKSMEIHSISCKITAIEPSMSGNLYAPSLQNFTSTITDFFTGMSSVVQGFVLWPLTTNPNDFISIVPAAPATTYTPNAAYPYPPSLGGMSWVYSFRDWTSPAVTPGDTFYPPGSPVYIQSPDIEEWLWDACPACADTSPMGEVFFAASDLSYVVHEPNPALPFPMPVLGSSKDTTNTSYNIDLAQLFTVILACIWL